MPRLSDTTRAQRRQHILTSAWRCFSRDGFHATSMDDIIAATGMSSSAVYRYFRSKEEIIRASAEEGVVKVGEIFVVLLDRDPCPDPAETVTLLVAELHSRADNPEYDMTGSRCRHGRRHCGIPSCTTGPASFISTPSSTSSNWRNGARRRVSATGCRHRSRGGHPVIAHVRHDRDAPRRRRRTG